MNIGIVQVLMVSLYPLRYLAVVLVLALTPTIAAASELQDSVLGMPEPWTGDLDGMTERRLIRVLVVPNKTMFFLTRDG